MALEEAKMDLTTDIDVLCYTKALVERAMWYKKGIRDDRVWRVHLDSDLFFISVRGLVRWLVVLHFQLHTDRLSVDVNLTDT